MAAAGDLQVKFKKATDFVRALPPDGKIKPSQELQLKFYSHYKQATLGKCNIPRPGALDFTGKTKWDAWNALGDMSQDDAKKVYINALIQISKDNPSPEGEAIIKEITL